MKNKKSIIDTYNTIYIVDIVIANKYTTLEQLKKLYTYSDNLPLDKGIMEGVATTSTCTRIADNHPCILIKWNLDTPSYKVADKRVHMIGTMCHEAIHAAIDTWDFIQERITIDSQEPVAYYVEWIV